MWFNKFVIPLLRSPIHTLMSGSTMVLTLTGAKSGKKIQLPVNYVRAGELLLTSSSRDRSWWRNLRGGAAVKVLLQGVEHTGRAQVVEEPAAVAQAIAELVAAAPNYGKYLAVALDDHGQPDAADCGRAAHSRVVVRTSLFD